jgi:hypothetical protein
LRSRCTIRRWCAYWTASQIERKRVMRARKSSLCSSAYSGEALAVDELQDQVGRTLELAAV